MRKINLFDKSEEIFNKLPKKYAEIILNSILAKSLENGSLLQEAKTFLNTDDIKSLFESFNIELKLDKKEIKESIPSYKKEIEKNINFTKKQEKENKDFSAFEGFD